MEGGGSASWIRSLVRVVVVRAWSIIITELRLALFWITGTELLCHSIVVLSSIIDMNQLLVYLHVDSWLDRELLVTFREIALLWSFAILQTRPVYTNSY